MKLTVADIDKKVQDAANTRARLQEEEERADADLQNLKAEADAAIDAGDVDLYISIKGRIERISAEAIVRKRQAEKTLAPVTREECEAAWSVFRAGHDKAMTKRLAVLEEKRKEYIAAYMDAVALQEQACATRERLGQYIGLNLTAISNEVAATFPMITIPNRHGIDDITLRCPPVGVLDRDLAFVISYSDKPKINLLADPEITHLISVVSRGRS